MNFFVIQVCVCVCVSRKWTWLNLTTNTNKRNKFGKWHNCESDYVHGYANLSFDVVFVYLNLRKTLCWDKFLGQSSINPLKYLENFILQKGYISPKARVYILNFKCNEQTIWTTIYVVYWRQCYVCSGLFEIQKNPFVVNRCASNLHAWISNHSVVNCDILFSEINWSWTFW